MECRLNCGVCCIIPSISSAIPGLPNGKKSGVVCPHLNTDYSCNIYNKPDKPKVCSDFKADILTCGNNRNEAIKLLTDLEAFCNLKS
ncbi:MAG: hypothetical protein A2046_10120 [Bacteroidetes bacterium GWA2_30_7]|nr:MAG: hypothetical protein A2046_10120 [Bacteroidetes bacterium GWA2_30_7]